MYYNVTNENNTKLTFVTATSADCSNSTTSNYELYLYTSNTSVNATGDNNEINKKLISMFGHIILKKIV